MNLQEESYNSLLPLCDVSMEDNFQHPLFD